MRKDKQAFLRIMSLAGVHLNPDVEFPQARASALALLGNATFYDMFDVFQAEYETGLHLITVGDDESWGLLAAGVALVWSTFE